MLEINVANVRPRPGGQEHVGLCVGCTVGKGTYIGKYLINIEIKITIGFGVYGNEIYCEIKNKMKITLTTKKNRET